MSKPFYFFTQLHLVKLLGIKAKNPVELLELLKKVPTSSVYYHTHVFLQKQQFLASSDFAYWISNVLNLKELGEEFASVDTINFKNIEELRKEFIKILTDYISKGKYIAECLEGQEFYFMDCVTFVLSTPYVANNLEEFNETLSKISTNSLYFHMFESRMRLGKDENDFAVWLKSIGEKKLAEEISKLDPYAITLDGLRRRIIALIKKYGKH